MSKAHCSFLFFSLPFFFFFNFSTYIHINHSHPTNHAKSTTLLASIVDENIFSDFKLIKELFSMMSPNYRVGYFLHQ